MKDVWKTGSPTACGGFEHSWANPVLKSAIRKGWWGSAVGTGREGHPTASPALAQRAGTEPGIPRALSPWLRHPGHRAGHTGSPSTP